LEQQMNCMGLFKQMGRSGEGHAQPQAMNAKQGASPDKKPHSQRRFMNGNGLEFGNQHCGLTMLNQQSQQ